MECRLVRTRKSESLIRKVSMAVNHVSSTRSREDEPAQLPSTAEKARGRRSMTERGPSGTSQNHPTKPGRLDRRPTSWCSFLLKCRNSESKADVSANVARAHRPRTCPFVVQVRVGGEGRGSQGWNLFPASSHHGWMLLVSS